MVAVIIIIMKSLSYFEEIKQLVTGWCRFKKITSI